MSTKYASSDDADRLQYCILRDLFTAARISAHELKSLGWRLTATYTDPGTHVMTEYENEYSHLRIRMDSRQDHHVVTVIMSDGTERESI